MTELYFIQSGSLILCENSTYQEPIILYNKGSVLNLYNQRMKVKSKFVLRSTFNDEYLMSEDNYVTFTGLHYDRRDAIFDHSKSQTQYCTELMTLPGERLDFFCTIWPDSAKVID